MKLKQFLEVTYPIEFTRENYRVMDNLLSEQQIEDIEITTPYDSKTYFGRQRMEWFEREYGECNIDTISLHDNHIIIWIDCPH